MRQIGRLVLCVGSVAVLLTACGESPSPTGSVPDGEVALIETEAGLEGVIVGSSRPLWTVPRAVAAPDGSAIFVLESGPDDRATVLRVDPTSGRRTVSGTIPGAAGHHVAAVAPLGRRLVTAGREIGGRTRVQVFDPELGEPVRAQTFEGVVEPEAFSPDGYRLYGARVFGGFYRVHVFDLITGDQVATSGPDKSSPPEDMHGAVVQAALSWDGRQLATLYRDPDSPDHTAFVHLLSLENGGTVCVDLHAPFGAPSGDALEAIEWRSDGSVAVGHTPTGGGEKYEATFQPDSIWSGEPQPHYHADMATSSSPPAPPAGVTATPGFRRFVALAVTG